MEIHIPATVTLSSRNDNKNIDIISNDKNNNNNNSNTNINVHDNNSNGNIEIDNNIILSKTPNSVSTTDTNSLRGNSLHNNDNENNSISNTLNNNNNTKEYNTTIHIDSYINKHNVDNSNSNSNSNSNTGSVVKDEVKDCKIDITQLDEEVSKILQQLEQIEKKINMNNDKLDSIDGIENYNNDNNHNDINSFNKLINSNNSTTVNDMRYLIHNFKSTILRLNLKNTLIKNQLSNVKDDYLMERFMLINKIDNLEKTMRIIQDENNAVNSRNLKLIKYIRTLKNEKLKMYILENKRLKDHIERLENESFNNLNAIRVNHPQRYSSIPSPLNSSTSTMPPPINLSNSNHYFTTTSIASNNIGNTFNNTLMRPSMGSYEEDYDIYQFRRQQVNSPTNSNMLDTLGRLATEYLHNEYPDDDNNNNNNNNNNESNEH